MTVPLWSVTGGYELWPMGDKIVWRVGEGPRRLYVGVMSSYGPQPAFDKMVREDLYGATEGFICWSDNAELSRMMPGDLGLVVTDRNQRIAGFIKSQAPNIIFVDDTP